MLVALGLKKVLLHVADTDHYATSEGLHDLPIWALTCGTALYLDGFSAMRKRNLDSWNTQRLALAVVLVAVTPALGLLPVPVVVAVVAVACALLVAVERTISALCGGGCSPRTPDPC